MKRKLLVILLFSAFVVQTCGATFISGGINMSDAVIEHNQHEHEGECNHDLPVAQNQGEENFIKDISGVNTVEDIVLTMVDARKIEQAETIPNHQTHVILIPENIDQVLMSYIYIQDEERIYGQKISDYASKFSGLSENTDDNSLKNALLSDQTPWDISAKDIMVETQDEAITMQYEQNGTSVVCKFFADNSVYKEVSYTTEDVTYTFKNLNNTLMVKTDNIPIFIDDTLTQAEIDEFNNDYWNGLLTKKYYSIADVREYLLEKHSGKQGEPSIVKSASQSGTKLLVNPPEGMLGEHCATLLTGSPHAGYFPGLSAYTIDGRDIMPVTIYDTRRNVLVEEKMTAKIFLALTDIKEVLGYLNIPQTVGNAMLHVADVAWDITANKLTEDIVAVYQAEYNTFLIREGTAYDHTVAKGMIELIEAHASGKLTYGATGQGQDGYYTGYVYQASDVTYDLGCGSDPQEYANYAVSDYYIRCRNNDGRWPLSSNHWGGLEDGTQFGEHVHSYDNACDQICNGCGENTGLQPKHGYTNSCDSSCNICGFIDTSRTHSWGSWINNGAGGEIRSCTNGCGERQTQAHTLTTGWLYGIEPTCTQSAVKVSTCSTCSYREEKDYPAGHDWRTYSEASHPHAYYDLCAKCFTKEYTGGYATKAHGTGASGSGTCPSCGSHSYVGTSCTSSGECACGAMTPAWGHNYSGATCTVKATCTRCNAIGSALGHSWGTTWSDASHPHAYYHVCSRCSTRENTGGYATKSHGSGASGSGTCPSCGSHSYSAGNCKTLRTCSCGATNGYGSHSYSAGTCKTLRRCSICGATNGYGSHNFVKQGSITKCTYCGQSTQRIPTEGIYERRNPAALPSPRKRMA